MEGEAGVGESLRVALGVELLAVLLFAEKSCCSVAGLQALRDNRLIVITVMPNRYIFGRE